MQSDVYIFLIITKVTVIMNKSNFFLQNDLQFALSPPEVLFSNLFVHMADLTHLPGPTQMLLPLSIFPDFP